MRALSRATGDVLIVLFAVAVLIGSVAAIRSGKAASSASFSAPSTVAVTTSSSPTPGADPASAAPGASGGTSTVVLAGPDLQRLSDHLAHDTGYRVQVARGAAPEVLAPDALTALAAPSAVVLEVLAGSRTTVRTTAAITAVRAAWPDAQVIVIGPFSAADRKSAAAAKSAAVAGRALFLDPVLLHWRTKDSSPVLTADDLTAVTAKLAAALA